MGTLVERTSRLVLLLHLGKDKSALAVEAAMRKAIGSLPEEFRRSITWDSEAKSSPLTPRSRSRPAPTSTSPIRTVPPYPANWRLHGREFAGGAACIRELSIRGCYR